MIPHKKSAWFVRWFTTQVERRIRKTFSAVHIKNLERLQHAVDAGPTLVVSNHLCWWDPMFIIVIGHRLVRADAYAMMDAKNLQRLPFLGRIGGFGVELDNPRDSKRILKYTAGLLDAPGRLVWIFPQGEERPSTAPIDDFKRGAALVAAMARVPNIVPVGIRYEFRSLPAPEAYMAVGEPLPFDLNVKNGRAAQQEGVIKALREIDTFIRAPSSSDTFEQYYARTKQPGALAERLLSYLARY